MADTLFTNVRIFDGTSRKTRAGEVRVAGNRIAALAKKGERLSRDGAALIDGEGMTLMPGLVNTHCHPSFTNYADIQELGDLPVEEHAIRAAANAKLLLDSGFTAFVSAAASKPRLDIALRNMIDAGHIPGPRMRATTPELTITGGFADSRRPGADKPAAGICCNGAEEFRRTIRWLIGEGVDIVKFIISGDSFGYPGVSSRIDPITEEELRAICETTLGMGRRLAAHAHTDASVRACIKHGVEFIYHASYCTDATVEALAKVKDKHYVSPAIGVRYFAIHEGERWGLTPEMAETMGLVAEVEAAKVVIRSFTRRESKSSRSATTASPGRPTAPTAGICNSWSICSACRTGRFCARRPPTAAKRSRASPWAGSRRATSPTSCWSTAIRWPTCACWRTGTTLPQSCLTAASTKTRAPVATSSAKRRSRLSALRLDPGGLRDRCHRLLEPGRVVELLALEVEGVDRHLALVGHHRSGYNGPGPESPGT